jgi:formiminotetrahydrofolate cyclodeaminase
LLELVAGLAGDSEAAVRAAVLRGQLLGAGERELCSYETVLAALRLPAGDPSRKEVLDAALSAASEAPLAIVRATAEVADLAASVFDLSKVAVRADAVASVLLAEAAGRAAARIVETNLSGRADDPRLIEIGGLTRRAAAARERVLSA